MNEEILFTETQRFRQVWLWVILIAANLISIFGAFRQMSNGLPLLNPLTGGRLTTIVVLLLVTGLIFMIRMDTTIKSDGLYMRFYPFNLQMKRYSWHSISQAFVRKYNPILEYGGWGIRLGSFGNGAAFNISGNKGIQLVFKNGDRALIGTQKPDEATIALAQLKLYGGNITV